jgi:GGDEF domain-containing protein
MTAGEASTDSGKDAIAPELLLRQAEIALKVAKEQKRAPASISGTV